MWINFLFCSKISEPKLLDAPAEYPQYGQEYYAVFFSDPDGLEIGIRPPSNLSLAGVRCCRLRIDVVGYAFEPECPLSTHSGHTRNCGPRRLSRPKIRYRLP